MSTFLLHVPLPIESAPLAERIIRTAISFLEIQGTVERTSLGDFERTSRKESAGEALSLVALKTANDEDAQARARALEGVLRSTLAAAGMRPGDVRVFVGSK
jgi:hypothetical protein